MTTTDNPITYDPPAGSHINRACQVAATMAKDKRCDVHFSFNGIELLATPDSVPSKLEAEFHAKLDAEAKAYRESMKGKAEAEQRTQEIIANQAAVDLAISELPTITGDMDALMRWMRAFANDADDIGVRYDKQAVAAVLIAGGFAENEHRGSAPGFFTTRERMGRYIVGQAINCLRIGMGPHPITTSFVDKYFAIPA